MGSCFSTGANSALKNHHHPSPSDKKLRSNAAVLPPPPPPPEEETVKEVMSETPKSKPQIPRLDRESSKRITRPDMHKTREQEDGMKKPQPMKEDEVSDVSGSSQTASTITAAKLEKGGEVLRRSKSKLRSSEFNGEMKMKSPPKLRNNAVSDVVKERNMTVNKSSSRRYDRSPVKRSEPSPVRARQNLGQRKDPGEISGRRSNSPATLVVENGCGRSTVLGRTLSGRKTGSSSGRFRSDQSVRIRKMGDVTDKEEKWPAAMPPPTVKESLENPLVSLECYIFF